MPRRGAPVHDLVGWLTGATRTGDLIGLPPYPDREAGPVDADAYARRLLRELAEVAPGSPALGLVEARGFRFQAWAETARRPDGGGGEVGRSRIRKPDDPAGRGLDIGRSLRAITKGTQATPGGDLDDSPGFGLGAESPGSRGTRIGLVAIFGVPLLIALGVGVGRAYPIAVSWIFLGLVSVGLLLLLSRIVPASAVRDDRADPDLGANPDRRSTGDL